MTGAFGQVLGAYPDSFTPLSDAQRGQAETARRKLLDKGIDYSNEIGDVFRARAKDILPDPITTHQSEQIVAGVAKFATKLAGYSLTGPMGAAALIGGDEALAEADRLKQQGVDLSTRTKAGAVSGVAAAAAPLIPIAGTTIPRTVGAVAVAGPGSFMASTAATRAILDNAGYKDIAGHYDPFDPVGLAVSTLVPAAFGALGYRASIAKPIRTTADLKAAVAMTPEEAARSAAFEASPANLQELRAAIASEKNPQARAMLEAELVKQSHAQAASVSARANPDLVAAARVSQVSEAIDSWRLTPDSDLPGFNSHVDALTLAHDQLARGDQVNVLDRLPLERIDAERARAAFESDPVIRPTDIQAPAIEGHALVERALGRLSAQIERTGRREYDLAPLVQQARALLQGGRGRDQVIADAAAAGTPLDPALHNVVTLISQYRNQPDLLSAMVRHYADQVRNLAPDQAPHMHDLIADAHEGVRQTSSLAYGSERAMQGSALRYPHDMLMRLDTVEEALPAGDMLNHVRSEARAEMEDAQLLRIAAECFLGAS
jgi:hypothetical protein